MGDAPQLESPGYRRNSRRSIGRRRSRPVSVRTVAAVALALGTVLLFSLVTLALFFAVGGPFGG